MSESASDKPVIYDVIVDFGNGTHVKIERGLSAVAAEAARTRASKFFLGVQVVKRLRAVGRRGRPAKATFG